MVDKLTCKIAKAEMERDKFANKAKHYQQKYKKELVRERVSDCRFFVKWIIKAARKELEGELARKRMDCDDAFLVLGRKMESMDEEINVLKKIYADVMKRGLLKMFISFFFSGWKADRFNCKGRTLRSGIGERERANSLR